jgi:hypothetical protein
MFSPNAPTMSTTTTTTKVTPTFVLPESFKLSNFAGSIGRISGDIVTSLAAKYQHVEDYEDDGVEVAEQFEWEDGLGMDIDLY